MTTETQQQKETDSLSVLLCLVADLRESLESLRDTHNDDPEGVDGWEIGLALARLKAVELHIQKT